MSEKVEIFSYINKLQDFVRSSTSSNPLLPPPPSSPLAWCRGGERRRNLQDNPKVEEAARELGWAGKSRVRRSKINDFPEKSSHFISLTIPGVSYFHPVRLRLVLSVALCRFRSQTPTQLENDPDLP